MMQLLFLAIGSLFTVVVGNGARLLREGLDSQRAALFASPESIDVPPAAWPRPGMGSPQNASDGNIAIPPPKDSDDALEAATDEFDRTYDKAYDMNPAQMIKHDIQLVMDYLMPGKRPDLEARKAEGVLILIAMTWFVIYRQFIFQTDRAENIDRWSNEKRHPIRDSFEMQPDLVLVFHHPDHKYSDSERLVSQSTILRALVSCKDDDDEDDDEDDLEFARTRGLRRQASVHQGLFKKLGGAFTPRAGQNSPRAGKSSPNSPNQDEPSVTVGQVRAALLQDVYEALSTESAGFFTDVFASVDRDELHVCVSLHSAETIRRQLELNAVKLKLQKGIVKEKLGVEQPEDEDESSPPYVQYSEALSQLVMGSGKSDFDLFQVYGKTATRCGRGTILSGQQRIQLVYKYLNRRLDLDFAVSEGLLVQWFPAHNTGRIADLQACWARWSLMLDLTFLQPISLLNDYFSSRVAFIFAWNGHYCKLLLAITPVAIAFELANLFLWQHGSVLGFGIILAGWGKWALNTWSREQEYFCTLWNLQDSHKDKSQRADFKGTLLPSHVDHSIQEMYCSTWEYTGRMSVSWLVTAVAIAVNTTTLLVWMDLWQGRMPIGAILVQAGIVQVSTAIFNWMAEALTTAENHKYQEHYYNSYLYKMFLFQVGNQYSPYFYIAMKQQFTARGCQSGDCIGVIRSQLPGVLGCLAALRVVQVVYATCSVEFELWRETQALIRAGGERPNYCYVEKQSKFGKFRIREQIEVMTQLTVTLGYVLIFGAAVPGIVPLCFVVFLVQLRAEAITVTTATNRTVPRISKGIGVWMTVVEFLQVAGIMFSGYLLVQFEPLFQGAAVLTKFSCMCFFCGVLLASCKALDYLVPTHSHRTETLQARRDYSARKLKELVEKKTHPRRETDSKRTRRNSRDTHFCSEIRDAQWSKIPRANDTSMRLSHQTSGGSDGGQEAEGDPMLQA